MYSLTQDVIKGMNIVTALQSHPNMPGINDVFIELDYFVSCVMDTEQFYGVPFKKKSSDNNDGRKEEGEHFDAVGDVKAHLREFYFGGSQVQTFGFRPRALFMLVIEPLLDTMGQYGHDGLLDCAESMIEQLKDHALISEHEEKLDPAVAYKLYRSITSERLQDQKVKTITAGVMRLRKKTLAIQKEIQRMGKT